MNVYNYTAYRAYLKDKLLILNQSRRGMYSHFASAIQCRPSYLTQVFKGQCDLSLEQAHMANIYLNHNHEEADFFLLLIQAERSGHHELKQFFAKKIENIRRQKLKIQEKIKAIQAPKKDLSRYCSSWIYPVLHNLLMVSPHLSSKELASAMKIEMAEVLEALEELKSLGIIIETKDGVHEVQSISFHLGQDSSHLRMFHSSLRIKALQKIQEKSQDEDLLYSSVVSLSAEDFLAVREILVEAIKKAKDKIAHSKSEKVGILNLDFYSVLKTH